MNAKRFLITALALLLTVAAGYALLVDRLAIPERELPYSYRQFLLESSSDIRGKVVIESGSNSVHAINPFMLSEFLQAPVITTAGNAGYPLRLRILNLQRHLNPGDTLLLPLEWNQYQADERYPENFLAGIADEHLRLAFFYNGLPVLEKLRFIFQHYPPHEVWRALQQDRDPQRMRQEDIARLAQFSDTLAAMDHNTFGNSMRNVSGDRKDPLASRLGCNQYLFSAQWRKGFAVSDTFEANLKLIGDLRDRGVAVYFTWPAVVDSPRSACYQGPKLRELLPAYAELVESTLKAQGFDMIGAYGDSHFPQACFLDTYYHLRRDCADTRTLGLIAALPGSMSFAETSTGSQQSLANAVGRRISALRSTLTAP